MCRISLETLDADLQWLTGRTRSVEEGVQRDTGLLQQLDGFLQVTWSLPLGQHARSKPILTERRVCASVRHHVAVLAAPRSAAAEEGGQRAHRLLLRGQRRLQTGRLLRHLPHLLLQVRQRCQGEDTPSRHELHRGAQVGRSRLT